MEIRTAQFVISNSDYLKCPTTGLPEFAFIGRSNVGKSSLINKLVGNKGLAKTSVRPGKTQLINHFLINNSWYLVDLPGYGFAKVSKSDRDKWKKMIENYLLNRETLANTFVLIDSRIEPLAIDLNFLRLLGENGVPLSVVFTKVDKQNQSSTAKNVNAFKKAMLKDWEVLPPMFLTSSVTGTGRGPLLNYIGDMLELLEKNKIS